MFSKNDDIVPVRHADKFRKQLSEADITIFEKKGGHFQVATFPELVEEIQNDIASL